MATTRGHPTAVSVASLLLVVNLLLSVSVTVLALADFDQLARVGLRHLAAGTDLRLARQTFRTVLYVRAVANVAVGVLYVFLIVRLRQGRWRVWRRMVWLSGAGGLGMLFLLTRPYPAVFHAEQAVQLVVLLGILACLLTPTTRAFIEPNPRRVPIGASTRR